jgi:methylated-DNA-protein-cysteine methyltransferase related protein
MSAMQPAKQPGLLYQRIYDLVRAIPSGRVTTYGAIGAAAGCPARVVGYAMHHLGVAPRPDVPWQRVINARGGISTHGAEQRRLLEAEGVAFGDDGTVDLERFGWWDMMNDER